MIRQRLIETESSRLMALVVECSSVESGFVHDSMRSTFRFEVGDPYLEPALKHTSMSKSITRVGAILKRNFLNRQLTTGLA